MHDGTNQERRAAVNQGGNSMTATSDDLNSAIDRPLPSTTEPVVVVHATTCTLDCPDTCSLAVTVTDGVITDIDAGPGNPLTDGWICAKVKKHTKRIYGPDRVLTPLLRTGPKGSGQFRQATWDEALTLIAERMNTALATGGPDSIVPFTYNSSAGVHERGGYTEALFAAIGATSVAHSICAATASAAWDSVYDSMHSADPLDIVHAQLVVIWGANPTVSNTHLPPLVQQAVRNGAKVVVIDPRRTAMAKRADLHLAIRPGTDVVLALAVANYWATHHMLDNAFIAEHVDGVDEFLAEAARWPLDTAASECGVHANDIEQLAQWFGTTTPTMLRIGWGLERNANGGAGCRAVLALPALVNHFGQLGGGTIGSTSSGSDTDAARRWPTFTAPQQPRRSVPMHQIDQWLAPGSGDPCQVLFVQGANPALMCPNANGVRAALERTDVFTVVHEQVMTDTARYGDVVLPATTAFEINDVASSYGSFVIQPVNAVIERVGQSRSNDEVGLALAHCLGITWERRGVVNAVDDLGPRMTRTATVQMIDTRPQGGKIRLVDPGQGVPRYLPLVDDRYPLTLISPASSKTISSMFGEFQGPQPTVMLHPDDAAARSIAAGDQVEVHNQRGTITLTALVSDETCCGTVITPKGIWQRDLHDSVGINALIPSTADALVGGACFNDTRVEVRGPRS
jgi:anaerobic selenocysteine-containing dehydrogenase